MEHVSVDEAFVDLTVAVRVLGNPVQIAQNTRQQIADELGLPSSVGISSTKLIAKMASSASKPNGLRVFSPNKVHPMPVRRLWGVGDKTSVRIHGLGIYTVKELHAHELGWLQKRCGRIAGMHLYDMSRGIDHRKVDSGRDEKSIGAEHTFT